MARKYVVGLGIVTTPDPVDKSIPKQVLKTLAEDASLLPQEKQGHTQKYTGDAFGGIVQNVSEIVKHELLTSHKHDKLAESDADTVKEKPGEVFDGEGDTPDDVAELSPSDATDIKQFPGEVFDEGTGEPAEIDELAESDADIETGLDGEGDVDDEGEIKASDVKTKQVTDKSQALKVGQAVFIAGPRQEAVVKAVHEDGSMDVTVGDQMFSVKAHEVMPS